MKQIYKLILAFLAIPVISFAQTDYRPGAVVTLTGDTLRGFVNYLLWENNPRKISFKSSANGAVTKYTANNIKYFNVTGGYLSEYVSYAGLITTDNTDINHLVTGRDTSMRQDTVFLKIVQKGKNITLYSYADNTKFRFFISKPGRTPEELIFRLYYNPTESGAAKTIYENTYQRQLFQEAVRTNTLTDALTAEIERSEYQEQDITRITGVINGLSKKELSKDNHSKHSPFAIALAVVGIIAITIELINEFTHVH